MPSLQLRLLTIKWSENAQAHYCSHTLFHNNYASRRRWLVAIHERPVKSRVESVGVASRIHVVAIAVIHTITIIKQAIQRTRKHRCLSQQPAIVGSVLEVQTQYLFRATHLRLQAN
jgi:O-succinylbenzoate synthase